MLSCASAQPSHRESYAIQLKNDGLQARERFEQLNRSDDIELRIKGYRHLLTQDKLLRGMTWEMRANVAWNLADDLLTQAQRQSDLQHTDHTILTSALKQVEQAVEQLTYARRHYPQAEHKQACDPILEHAHQLKEQIVFALTQQQVVNATRDCRIHLTRVVGRRDIICQLQPQLGLMTELELESILLETKLETKQQRLLMLPNSELLRKYPNADDIATAYWNCGFNLFVRGKRLERTVNQSSIQITSDSARVARYWTVLDQCKRELTEALSCMSRAQQIYLKPEMQASCDIDIADCKTRLDQIDRILKQQETPEKVEPKLSEREQDKLIKRRALSFDQIPQCRSREVLSPPRFRKSPRPNSEIEYELKRALRKEFCKLHQIKDDIFTKPASFTEPDSSHHYLNRHPPKQSRDAKVKVNEKKIRALLTHPSLLEAVSGLTMKPKSRICRQFQMRIPKINSNYSLK